MARTRFDGKLPMRAFQVPDVLYLNIDVQRTAIIDFSLADSSVLSHYGKRRQVDLHIASGDEKFLADLIPSRPVPAERSKKLAVLQQSDREFCITVRPEQLAADALLFLYFTLPLSSKDLGLKNIHIQGKNITVNVGNIGGKMDIFSNSSDHNNTFIKGAFKLETDNGYKTTVPDIQMPFSFDIESSGRVRFYDTGSRR